MDATKDARLTVDLDQQSIGRLDRMDAIERKAMADAAERLQHLEIKQLEAALKRLDDREFGYCADCAHPIEKQRLLLNLAVMTCIYYARGQG